MNHPATATASPTDRHDVDPAFPTLHGRPPTGWLNDPNGCSRLDGTWHVYYQHNPHAPVHGDIHWGHMSSTDLLHWRTEPIALAPRPDGPDAGGCWSGSLVDDGGVPTAVFTGIDADGRPSTVLARSDRAAVAFTRDEAPVAGLPRDPALTDVRDPFLFTVAGRRYAVQGAGAPGGVGQVLLYRCDELTDWSEIGTLLRSDHPVLDEDCRADIWECPSLVHVDGTWVLVVSIWRHVEGATSLNHVVWITGDLVPDGDGLAFTPTASGRLDHGDAYYAPQALAVDGRVLIWGWSWETDHGSERLATAPWQGVLTYPRELTVAEGRVLMRPAPEVDGLRRGPADLDDLPAAFEVVADAGTTFGLTLDGVAVGPADGVVRALVDASLVELTLSDGASVTTRAYPTASSRWGVGSDGYVGVTAHALGL